VRPSPPTRAVAGALCVALCAPLARASAQTELTLELGGSRIGPAVGFDAEDSRFLMGGLRASVYGPNGSSVYASLLAGTVVGDSLGGDFVSGLIEGSVRDAWTDRWTGSMDFKLFGFGVREPFPYRMLGAELGPAIRYRTPRTAMKVGVLAGVGTSRVELMGGLRVLLLCPPAGVCEDDLWRVGTTAEYLVGSPTVQVGVAGSAHESSGDRYTSLGGRLVFSGRWGAAELRVDRWDTPLGFETTGGVTLSIPFGGSWSFRAFAGRTDPDPLTLAQPGSGSGGALLGWSFLSTAREPERGAAPYEMLGVTERGARVRLSIAAPAGAAAVAVLGDFSLWEPVAMRREGSTWVVELEVETGTHHYGFLVDDEWYVPDDAPDVVPDEWGRLTATLVIEGAR